MPKFVTTFAFFKDIFPNTNHLRSKFLRDSASVVAAGLMSQLLTVVLTGIVTRTSSKAEFGFLISLMSLATFLIDLSDFGSSQYLLREIARGAIHVRAALRFALLRGLLLVAGSCLAVIAVQLLFALSPLIWVLGVYPAMLGAHLTLVSCLRALGKFGLAALATILDRTVALLAVVLMTFGAHLRGDVAMAIAFPVGLSVAALFSVLSVLRTSLASSSKLSVRRVYSDSRHLGLSTMVMDLSSFEVPIVAGVGGSSAAAVFGVVQRATGALGLPASAVASALYPRASNGNWRSGFASWARTNMLAVPVLLAYIICGIWAEELISLLYGNEYAIDAAPVLRVVLVAVAIGYFNQTMATLLQAQRHERSVSRLLLLAIPSGLAMTAGGTYFFGALGAALGVALTQTSIFLTLALLVWKVDRESKI